jgi:trehalose-6-phosphatase
MMKRKEAVVVSGVLKKTTKTSDQFMSWQRSVLDIIEYKTEELPLESFGSDLRLLSYE